ncbi:hypothetical protein RRG08_036259 [Elysia crispata]|uniref:Uncharacterized protein n=1 Tax=Elysia crispata TaxID=231223 RepID=A0AAE1D652_9GAST|nr:hypothetical protein RRG08_036259 [Elysia crispata]
MVILSNETKSGDETQVKKPRVMTNQLGGASSSWLDEQHTVQSHLESSRNSHDTLDLRYVSKSEDALDLPPHLWLNCEPCRAAGGRPTSGPPALLVLTREMTSNLQPAELSMV